MLTSYWKTLLFLILVGCSFSSCSILQADYDWNQVEKVEEIEKVEKPERVDRRELRKQRELKPLRLLKLLKKKID